MSTIRPILEYGSIIFDNCSMSDKLKLEKCQRQAAIICTGAMRRTETETLLKELRWDSLAARRHLLKISFFHKIVEGTISPYLQKNLTFINQGTINHNTRMARLQKIKPLQCRLESYKKSFFPQCINEWNGLPENITSITNDNSFKNKLKHHYQMHTGLNKIGLQNYSYPGFLGKKLMQIKLGLSPLNAHLFKYNISDNPYCPKCGLDIETPEHFFLQCTCYINIRTNLLNYLENIGLKNESNTNLLHAIIFGYGNDRNINDGIIRHVIIFLYKTGRFHSPFSTNQ